MSGLATTPQSPAGANGRVSPAAVSVAVGAVVMTAGTFAPWLASGASERNLYSSAGLVQRLAGLGRPVGLALDALPLTSLYCIAAGVAYVMGTRRIAAGAIALLAVVFAGISVAALSHRRPGEIHLLAVGPSVTLAGALVCLVTMLAVAGQGQRAARARRRTVPARPTSPTGPQTSTNSIPNPTPHPMTTPMPKPSQGRPRTMEFR